MHQQIEKIRMNVHDALDKPDDAAAGRLMSELKGLEDDFKQGKDQHHIEYRIKEIVNVLGGAAKDARIMNYEQIDYYRDYFEKLRQHFK